MHHATEQGGWGGITGGVGVEDDRRVFTWRIGGVEDQWGRGRMKRRMRRADEEDG